MKPTMMARFTAVILLLTYGAAVAQDAPQDAPPPLLKQEELQQMVAPIALYPDALLSQVLIASTYPLEVVEANRWVKANSKLTGDARKDALEKQSWDASIKSLTNTPSVLATMSDKLDWTQKLGDAVLAQQPDVMDAVQVLRTKAEAAKTLTTTQQQKVETQTVDNKQVIIIEQAQPSTVYVPYYDPAVVYGAWAYPAYPPVYYPPPPGYVATNALVSGIAFGAGIAIAGAIWGNNDFNWGHGDINVNVNNNFVDNRHINNRPGANGGGTQWHHDPAHRHGVQYQNAAIQQKFNPNSHALGANNSGTRADFRGHDGKQVLQPSANAASGRNNLRSAGNPTRAADHANVGARQDVSGVSARSNNAFAGVGNGAATRAQADRGRASLGGAERPAAAGGLRGGGLRRR